MVSTNSDNHLPPGQAPIRTSSIELFRAQIDLLRSAQHAPPAIGIVGGRPGTGKSIATHLYLAEEEQKWQPPDLPCVLLDILPRTTTKWLLNSIAHRMGDVPPSCTLHEALEHVLRVLEQRRVRLLMIDNADYLTPHHMELLQTLLWKSTCSVLLIGLPRLLTAISTNPQLEAHVGLFLLFPPLPEEEVIASFLPRLTMPGWVFSPQNELELQMGKYLWRKSCPSLRRLRMILTYASRFAQRRGTPTITLEEIRLAVLMMAPQGDSSNAQGDEEDM